MATQLAKELKIAMARVEKAKRELEEALKSLNSIAAFYKIQ